MEVKNQNVSSSNRFNVVVRLRPELKLKNEEKKEFSDDLLYPCTSQLSEKEVKLVRPGIEERTLEFDRIIGKNASQEEMYEVIGRKVVDDVLEGYNGTIMAYGQTGSGKTYTIFGTKKSIEYNDDISAEMGIVPRVIRQIFDHIRDNDKKLIKIRAIFMQVYNETISDLIIDPASEKSVPKKLKQGSKFKNKRGPGVRDLC